ncbi:MAG: hypothetical protein Q9181_006632 [Wetmoreana brouardii]
MVLSYMVTIVHFCSVGDPRIDVIDSRAGRDELASIRKILEVDSREITSRLIITEDLPRATYELLEHTIGVDPRLLDDHRKNGHGSDFVGQADLDVDKSSRSSATSVSIPFDLQIGPVAFPADGREDMNTSVEDDIGNKYKFLVSPDLWFSTSNAPSVRDTSRLLDKGIQPFFEGSSCAARTQQLLSFLTGEIGSRGLTQIDLTRSISTWIITNAHGSFETSVESSIRSWHSVKKFIRNPSGQYAQKKLLCDRLRNLTLLKLHQMDKAHTELGIDVTNDADNDKSLEYVRQQWHRSRRSLQWVLDEVEHAFRSNQSDLQIDLTLMQIEESRKAMQQTEVVKRLTALAFIFIPISTVCSAFGMNVQELSGNLPPVWISILVAVTVAAFTVICSMDLTNHSLWAILSLLSSFGIQWRVRWQEVYDTSFVEQASFGLGVVSIGANLAGVKLDPNRTSTKIKTLRGASIRVMAVVALIPCWLTAAISHRLESFQRRGRIFKARGPP